MEKDKGPLSSKASGRYGEVGGLKNREKLLVRIPMHPDQALKKEENI